jgi:hypothetical protein
VDRAAKALAAAGGVAHMAFFTVFAYRVIGRGGFGAIGWAILAAVALLGMGANFVGYYLIKHGGRWKAQKWGYLAIAASTALAGVLLAFATFM